MTDAVDVVVIGGGIGGASLAHALAQEGLGVTVLSPPSSSRTACAVRPWSRGA